MLLTEERNAAGEELRPAAEERPVIRALCPLFACRVCRTKTGWPHQRWCELSRLTEPDCALCRYWGEKKGKGGCTHAAVRRRRGMK